MPKRKVERVDLAPAGLFYFLNFLSTQEEEELLITIEKLDYYDFVLQGVAAKRKVRHYGFSYEFYSPSVQRIDDFPLWLNILRVKAAPLAGMESAELEQALIARYTPGAGIGWHRDAPAFGPVVLGISLASDDAMRFRRLKDDVYQMYKQPLSRGSLYVLSGAARSVWQHSLAPAKQLRYSITFRTVREQYRN